VKLFGRSVVAGFGGVIGAGIGIVLVSYVGGRLLEHVARKEIREQMSTMTETLRKMRGESIPITCENGHVISGRNSRGLCDMCEIQGLL
jgi:hypothetical protein